MAKVVIGFTCRCSSDSSPGLDGADPAFISMSVHFPGMPYILEVVTELEAKSGDREKGEDTLEMAKKVNKEIDQAVKSGHLSKENRKKIKIQHDQGGDGNTRARIILDGIDHVNFAAKDDGGKISWRAIIMPPKTPPGRGAFPVRYTGKGCLRWNRNNWNKKIGKRIKIRPIKKGARVPAPVGYDKNNEKFKDGTKASRQGETGLYVDETKPWKNV